jgi:hypothetical protein
MCDGIEYEFSRLQSLYETAGDQTLNRDAWLALVDLSDRWTEFSRARGALFKRHRGARIADSVSRCNSIATDSHE